MLKSPILFVCCLLLGMGTLYAGNGKNLIVDPYLKDFEKNWVLSTTTVEVFELTRDKASGAIDLRSTGTDYSGYITQIVPVKPRTRYRVSVTLRHFSGRGLIWITAMNAKKQNVMFDERKYLISSNGNPLVPDFVRKELLQGSGSSDWRTESFEFETTVVKGQERDIAYLRVGAGIYFAVAHLQVKHISLEEVTK